MKTASILLAMTLSCFAQQDRSVVRFSNGDQLTGDLLGLNGKKLSWKSQLLKEPAEFDLKYVVDLELPVGAPPADRPEVAHEAMVNMTNGDTIRGQLAGITDTEIRLATWYAEELVLKRVNVKSAKISSIADIHYRGPNSIEEWPHRDGGDGWSFRGGALHSDSPGGLAREINFPDESVISFVAAWRGAFRPKIVFLSKNITTPSDPGSGYEMVFQGNSVHVKKAGTNNWLGHSTNAGVLRENETAHIEIKVSLKSGKIALFVDDQLIDAWQDDAVDRDKLGKGFHIVAQDSSPLRISDIEISGWDGYLENVPDRRGHFQGAFGGGFELGGFGEVEKTAEEVIPEGRMLLRNGDTIEGRVMGIEGEEISLKTPFAEVKFPVARLKNLSLSTDSMEEAKLENGDVRATLADGSRLVFRLDGVEENAIIGYSQNFGTARFRKDAFKRIEFNLYPKNGEPIRQEADW
ncbi:MAG: hypothetical protein RLZZ505_2256 [Verrucomicrobiota bacterium]|jgi:hypothetical protein